MKEEYMLNVSLRSAGGNASKGALRGSINLPKEILNDIGITKEDKEVVLTYDTETKEIKIKKAEKVTII